MQFETPEKSKEWLKLVTLTEEQVAELISRKLSRSSIYSRPVQQQCKYCLSTDKKSFDITD